MGTIEIQGRGVYRSSPQIDVYEGDRWSGDPILRILHGDIDERRDTNSVRITSRHENGTDIEHDAAFVLELTGGGLTWDGLVGSRAMFRVILLRARFYPPEFEIKEGASLATLKGRSSDDIDDTITVCNSDYYHPSDQSEWPKGHLLMPYMPPRQKIDPGHYYLVVDFNAKGDK